MNSDRWERVQALFHAAAELPPPARAAWLERECGGDRQLAAEVLAMLAEDAGSEHLLDQPLEQIAGQVFETSGAGYRRIGPYRILSLLGEGGMGSVFLGVRDDLGSQAAIKILRDAWISPARRARFAIEQRTLARLDHRNIARLLDADTLTDGTPFFVMEYVDGLPLDRYADSRGHSIEQRLRLFRALCEAVQFAHDHAVIHRDLKPSNVLVKADGTVKLLDFGVARHMDSFDGAADRTRTGMRMLTPAYASPEQLRGEPTAIQSDVYSLGVILYQLLTGRLPFEISGSTSLETARQVLEADPVAPSLVVRRQREQEPGSREWLSAPRQAWADLDVLCLTALHKDVGKRYASAEALIRDMDRYLSGAPLEARRDSPGYRAGKFARRHRRALAAGAALVTVVAALVVYFIVRLAEERNAALAEAARTQRIERLLKNLFEGGDADAGPAKDLLVSTLVDRGAQEAHSLDQEPAAQAEMYETLGVIYQKLGNLDKADAMLRAALQRRRTSSALVKLGLLRVDQARLDEAERLVRQGLALAEKVEPAKHPDIGTATDALGRVLDEKGEYDSAIRVLERAVSLRSAAAGSAPGDLADSLFELSNVYFYAGKYKESEELNQRALAMNRRIYGERHPRIADVLINLGAIQFQQGAYAKAETFDRQALSIVESFYGPEHYRTASAATLLGRTLLFEKRYDEAGVLLRRALRIQERVFGPVHPKVASVLNDLGSVALKSKHMTEAAGSFRRSAEIYRTVYGGKHYYIGVATANLASVYMDSEQYRRAEPLFREAIAMFEQTLPAGHIETAIARTKLGHVLYRQQRYGEAEQELAAGYAVLQSKMSGNVSWAKTAQEDLAALRARTGSGGAGAEAKRP